MLTSLHGYLRWCVVGVAIAFSLCAPAKLHYQVDFDKDAHYLNVTLLADELDGPETRFDMAVWAPGYYLIVDFPKFLSDFSASTPDGQALSFTKQGKSRWTVNTENTKSVVLRYRVFANRETVAESCVSAMRAFVAPNGVFMYRNGHKDEPIEVSFAKEDGALPYPKVTTGLRPGSKPMTFEADGIDQLYDSPLLFGDYTQLSFNQDGCHYDVAIETSDGLDAALFLNHLQRMVKASTQLMGGKIPYKNYAFLFLHSGRGGLEHCNSQASFTGGIDPASISYYNTFSFITHEFFHLYNVKSIRPIELGPFDYSCEVFTPSLWISEGFTVYYETAIMHRAGLVDGNFVLRDLASYIETVEKAEGHRHMSLRQSSYDIWLNFFNTAENGKDVRISYYDKGPILGLLMDIEIRHLTQNKKSLDDVMRQLYTLCMEPRNPGEPTRGFTEDEFWQVCADVAGKPLTTMRRYVETTDEIDYPTILAHAGLMLNRKPADGIRLGDNNHNWQLLPMEKCTKQAKTIRRSMFSL